MGFKKGIYTLANDTVYDQLVALLNSIDKNVNNNISICVIPYDEKLNLIKAEISKRPNIFLFDDNDSIKRWETFSKEVWESHPAAKKKKKSWLYAGHTIRKFCAFDGVFERFVFYDVDSLAMKPLDKMFEKLNKYDFVFDDWEFAKPDEHAMVRYSIIEETRLFRKEDVKPKMHGMDFFGSKKGVFSSEEFFKLRKRLIENREIEWVNPRGLWDDVYLFAYMTFRSGRHLFNFTQSSDWSNRTGNCANADTFIEKDHVLYNQEGMKPIHRIHYMGYRPADFKRLSSGEDVDIRYRNIFLYYRFISASEKCPEKVKKPGLIKGIKELFKNYLLK